MKGFTLRAVPVLAAALVVGACASAPPASSVGTPAAPRFAEYPTPEIPASLVVSDAVRARHVEAWNALQAGDLRAASRGFDTVLKQAPDLYPAQAALGFVYLADAQYEQAQPWFAAALAADDTYLPAWIGQADALLGLGRDAEAIGSMERVLALDPQRDLVRTRLELVRFRSTQSLIDAGRQAREARQYDEAVRNFDQALALSPQSTMILRELTQVQMSAGQLESAERYARRMIAIDPRDGQAQALLGDVLEARGQYADASEAYARADALDPNPEWTTRTRELRERAEIAALPPEFGRIATAPTVTRADVAALVGIQLRDLIESAPARATSVATDVRDHWAAPWILGVTRAGAMTTYPNHTFQPATLVRRGDLAVVVAELVRLAADDNARIDLAGWRAARPTLADVALANVFYLPASLAVASGAMTTDSQGRFNPTANATGADLNAAVERIGQLIGR